MEVTEKLRNFRQSLYELLPKRQDAIMDLLDALSCSGHRCDSVVQLSNSNYFKRQYSSITDAIADGLPEVPWEDVRRLVYQCTKSEKQNEPHRFIVDCTAQRRAYASRLADRAITHYPNPAPGNKPICVGHQYSLLSMLPNEILENQKHWLVPFSVKRVSSDLKGNELGMHQIIECIEELGLKDELSISIGDSLYGTEQCRTTISEHDNLVHIFRLNSKRNVFFQPTEAPGPTGRKKEFGAKMNLGDPATHGPSCRETEFTQQNKKGKTLKVVIKCWNDMLLRGSRKFRSSQHPLNVVQICVNDEAGNAIFKRPLWLGILGKRRNEINLEDSYKHYRSRYDTEHLFRFGKQKLLFDKYQTADVVHEELWWQLCLLAYAQLYMSKTVAPCLPQPWERYLPEYKNHGQHLMATPSQTQRGFSKVLESVGTPTKPCIPRGKPRGRMAGDFQPKKPKHAVIFKTQKAPKETPKDILLTCDNSTVKSNPERTDELIQLVQDKLIEMNLSLPDFTEMLLNTT